MNCAENVHPIHQAKPRRTATGRIRSQPASVLIGTSEAGLDGIGKRSSAGMPCEMKAVTLRRAVATVRTRGCIAATGIGPSHRTAVALCANTGTACGACILQRGGPSMRSRRVARISTRTAGAVFWMRETFSRRERQARHQNCAGQKPQSSGMKQSRHSSFLFGVKQALGEGRHPDDRTVDILLSSCASADRLHIDSAAGER